MPDDKLQTTPVPSGRPDHDRVTADQTYEIEALMAKHHKTQKQVLDAIKGHVVAEAELMGKYGR